MEQSSHGVDAYIKTIFWRDVIVDWSIIILCYLLIAGLGSTVVAAACILLIGIAQYRLMVLFHDLMHRTIFRDRKCNFLIGNSIIGWWVGIDIKSFLRFHGTHHSENGSLRDPEIRDGKGSPIMKGLHRWELPMSPWKIAFWVIIEVVFGPLLAFLFILGMKVVPKQDGAIAFAWKECTGPLIMISTAGAALWALGALWIMGIWFLAFGLVFVALFHLRMLAEHMACAEGETIVLAEAKTWYEWLFAVTAGAHNIRYHHEHHENPRIPYMLLPKERAENLQQGLQTVRLDELLGLLSSSPKIASGEVLQKGDPRSIAQRIRKKSTRDVTPSSLSSEEYSY